MWCEFRLQGARPTLLRTRGQSKQAGRAGETARGGSSGEGWAQQHCLDAARPAKPITCLSPTHWTRFPQPCVPLASFPRRRPKVDHHALALHAMKVLRRWLPRLVSPMVLLPAVRVLQGLPLVPLRIGAVSSGGSPRQHRLFVAAAAARHAADTPSFAFCGGSVLHFARAAPRIVVPHYRAVPLNSRPVQAQPSPGDSGQASSADACGLGSWHGASGFTPGGGAS